MDKCFLKCKVMPLFGKSSKTPAEVVRGLKDSLAVLEKEETGRRAEKAVEEVSRHLVTIAGLLFSCDTEQQADIVLAQMSQEMYNSALIPAILRNLARMEFEARKEAAEIFKHVLKRQIGTRTPTVEYIATCDEILSSLVRGYQTPEICHNTGGMLRWVTTCHGVTSDNVLLITESVSCISPWPKSS